MIRQLTGTDRGTFVRLWKDALIDIEKYNPLMGYDIHSLSFFSDIFHAYTENYLRGGCWTFADDGQDVAIAMAGESSDKIAWHNRAGDMAQLWGLYTLPAYRSLGYSTQLAIYSREVMKKLGFDTYMTEVGADNEAAIKLMDSKAPDFGASKSIVRYIMYLGSIQ